MFIVKLDTGKADLEKIRDLNRNFENKSKSNLLFSTTNDIKLILMSDERELGIERQSEWKIVENVQIPVP